MDVTINGETEKCSGKIVRRFRQARGINQDVLGRRMNVNKARISKIEHDEDISADTLVRALKCLDIDAQLTVQVTSSAEKSDVCRFIINCVFMFAKKRSMPGRAAFNYLNRYRAIAFLSDCYDAEVTLPAEEIINDMTLVCHRNGGLMKL